MCFIDVISVSITHSIRFYIAIKYLCVCLDSVMNFVRRRWKTKRKVARRLYLKKIVFCSWRRFAYICMYLVYLLSLAGIQLFACRHQRSKRHLLLKYARSFFHSQLLTRSIHSLFLSLSICYLAQKRFVNVTIQAENFHFLSSNAFFT